MEKSTNKGMRKGIPAVIAGSASHPSQQRERPSPNYLKPTISSSCQHCTYPKHQQSSTTSSNTPMKKPHSLKTAASIPLQAPADQQPLAKDVKPSMKTRKAPAAAKSWREEKIPAVDISNGVSPPSCGGGGSDESDPDKKEARSENYWASEESMAGEESVGEAAALKTTKLKLTQRRESFEAPNAADRAVVEENRRSNVKAIVGAFQKLEQAG